MTQFWLKVKCGQEGPDTWKQTKQKNHRQRGGVLKRPLHLLPALRPTGVSPRVNTVNYLLRETQVKFEVFLTINEWVSVCSPCVAWCCSPFRMQVLPRFCTHSKAAFLHLKDPLRAHFCPDLSCEFHSGVQFIYSQVRKFKRRWGENIDNKPLEP